MPVSFVVKRVDHRRKHRHDAAMSDPELATRIERLEAESAIRALAARYCFAIDNHDLDEVVRLFTPNARVRSVDGVMDAVGRHAIADQFRGRFAVLGPSNHVSHDHWIRIDAGGRSAMGTLSAHAELWRHERTMITALRYEDRYERHEGVWMIAERVLSFLYYVPLSDYPQILGMRDRMRAYEKPLPADYPENLPSWHDYRDAE